MDNEKLKMENFCIVHCPLSIVHFQSLILFVQRMAAAAATELFELKPVRRVLFVFRRHVIALFALRALQNNVISRHSLIP
jgi:hypothetical protein